MKKIVIPGNGVDRIVGTWDDENGFQALSPADLQAAGLAGWAVWRDVISWLSSKIKSHWTQPERKIKESPSRIQIIQVLRFMADLEQKHSAALDKCRVTVNKAGAWADFYAWLGSQRPEVMLIDIVEKVDDLLARAEVERRQEGEEKDARTT